MEKFVREAEKFGIPLDSIKGMVERDLEYKADIYKKMRWLKIRQVVTLFVAALIFIMMVFILVRVQQNVHNLEELIKVLVVSFQDLNK